MFYGAIYGACNLIYGCSWSLLKTRTMKAQGWKDLNIKEKLGIGTAVLAFLFGWGLTICSAFVALLISEQGTLWVLGQSLVYTASVLGLSYYFKGEATMMKQDMQRYFTRQERLMRNKGMEDIPEEDEKDNE